MISVLILCLITAIPMITLVLEGPAYLRKKGEISKMVSTLSSIAVINSAKNQSKFSIYKEILEGDGKLADSIKDLKITMISAGNKNRLKRILNLENYKLIFSSRQ